MPGGGSVALAMYGTRNWRAQRARSRTAANEMWPVPLIVSTADPENAAAPRKALCKSASRHFKVKGEKGDSESKRGKRKQYLANGVVGSAVLPTQRIGLEVWISLNGTKSSINLHTCQCTYFLVDESKGSEFEERKVATYLLAFLLRLQEILEEAISCQFNSLLRGSGRVLTAAQNPC